MERWFLLSCKSRQERRVVKALESQHYVVYCPHVTVNKSKSLSIKKVIEPLFPGYIFIRVNLQNVNWSAVRYTRGVKDFVRFNKTAAMISESIITSLKENIQKVEIGAVQQSELKHGDKVRITEGCFEGLSAVFHSRSGKDRVLVLINVLGRMNETNVSAKSLELLVN